MANTSGHAATGSRAQGSSAVCEHCGEEVSWYVHSQMGPIKVGSWTSVDPDSDDDPRYGTTCYESPSTRHETS